MRKLRYSVAMSLDGFIADPNGGYDWIIMDESIDFEVRTSPHPAIRFVDTDPVGVVRELKHKAGKDIWLFGGGSMFRTLVDAGLVDTVEVAIMPVLRSEGRAGSSSGPPHFGYEAGKL